MTVMAPLTTTKLVAQATITRRTAISARSRWRAPPRATRTTGARSAAGSLDSTAATTASLVRAGPVVWEAARSSWEPAVTASMPDEAAVTGRRVVGQSARSAPSGAPGSSGEGFSSRPRLGLQLQGLVLRLLGQLEPDEQADQDEE